MEKSPETKKTVNVLCYIQNDQKIDKDDDKNELNTKDENEINKEQKDKNIPKENAKEEKVEKEKKQELNDEGEEDDEDEDGLFDEAAEQMEEKLNLTAGERGPGK